MMLRIIARFKFLHGDPSLRGEFVFKCRYTRKLLTARSTVPLSHDVRAVSQIQHRNFTCGYTNNGHLYLSWKEEGGRGTTLLDSR